MYGIGQTFPTTPLKAVMPNGSMNDAFTVQDFADGQKTLVFFYPLDFTFVCPTEIVAFNKAVAQFAERGCKVVAASVDSQFSHFAWRNTPLEKGGIGEVQFPMISDMQRKLADQLGIVAPDGVTFRATYLLDSDNVIRHLSVNDLPLGRSVNEALRMVDALNHFEEHGEVCPINWQKGEEAMHATQESTGAYLSKQA